MSLYVPEVEIARYSIHLDRIRECIRLDGELHPLAETSLTYVFLCFTNRSGSNLVAEAMASDGQLNLAAEFLNCHEVSRVAERVRVLTLQEYVSGVALHNQKASIFVSKIAIEHLNMLYSTGILDRIIQRSEFIFVERADKLGQAISYAIADQTNIWATYNEARKRPEEAIFARAEVDRLLELILHQNYVFTRFFAMNGIVPTTLLYEHFVRFPEILVSYIGETLGLAGLRYVPQNIHTGKQAGAINEGWRRLYLGGPSMTAA